MAETTLQMILDKQAQFQQKWGFKPGENSDQEIAALIHEHSAQIIEETIEMLRELPFHKRWKDYSDWGPDRMMDQFGKAREELIDVLIFLANVAVFLDMDEELIKEMYLEKLGINYKRQEDPELGYVNS
jgi:chloramphenicol 3-O-phosphotransferase